MASGIQSFRLKLGRSLFEAANEPKTWFPIPEADHNDLPWVGGKKYLDGIQRFLQHQGLMQDSGHRITITGERVSP